MNHLSRKRQITLFGTLGLMLASMAVHTTPQSTARAASGAESFLIRSHRRYRAQ